MNSHWSIQNIGDVLLIEIDQKKYSIFTFVMPRTERKTWMRIRVGKTRNTAFRQDTFPPTHYMKYYSYTTVDIILIFTQVEYFESDSNEKL